MIYHHQCASCYCTLSMDSDGQFEGDEEDEDTVYVMNDEICVSCQREQDRYDDDD